MKKTLLIIGIVILAIGGIVLGLSIAKHSEKSVKNEYTIDESFSNLDIDVTTSEVTFIKTNEAKAKVVLDEKEKEYHTVEVKDGTLEIKKVNTKKWFEYIFKLNFSRMKVTVYLPLSAYQNVKINSSTGNIKIPNDFSFGNVTISVSTGNVSFEAKTSGDFVVSASTGKVTLNKANIGGAATISVSTGNIELTEVKAKSLDISASTGKVTLTKTIVTDLTKIKTSTGDVLFTDSDSGSLNVKTSTGSVRGTLLTAKIFSAKSDTGKASVPKTTTGGQCIIETGTGDIIIKLTE